MILLAIMGLAAGAAAAALGKPRASPPVMPALPSRLPYAPVAPRAVEAPADGVTPAQAALIAQGPAQIAAAQAASAATYAPAATFLPAITKPTVAPGAVAMSSVLKSSVAAPNIQQTTITPAQAAAIAERDALLARQQEEARARAAALEKQRLDYAAAQVASAAAARARDEAARNYTATEIARQTDPNTFVARMEAGYAPLIARVLANQPGLPPAAAAALRAEAAYGFATQETAGACAAGKPPALCAVARQYEAKLLAEMRAAQAARAEEQAALARAKAEADARAIAASKAAQAAAQDALTTRYYANSPTAVPAAAISAMQAEFDKALKGAYGASANTVGALLSARTRAYDTAVSQLRWHFGTAPLAPIVQQWVTALDAWVAALRTEVSRGLSPFSPIPPRLLGPFPAPPGGVAGLGALGNLTYNDSPGRRANALRRALLARG